MVRWCWRLAAIAVLAAGAARGAPLEVYGKLPSVEDVKISPDGTRLALIQTDGEKRTIRVENLAQHKVERVLQVGDTKLRGLMWGGSDHLIVLRTTTAAITYLTGGVGEYLLGFDYNLVTGTAQALLRDVSNAVNTFSDPQVRVVDGKALLFVEGVHFVGSEPHRGIYRIDLDHDTSALVEPGDEGTEDFVLDARGEAIAQSVWSERTRTWTLKLKANNVWRNVRTQEVAVDGPHLLGLGRDGHSVLVQELKDNIPIVREVSSDGRWSEPLPALDDERIIYDPVHHNVIGSGGLTGDEERYNFFDPHDQDVWKLVQRAYPDQAVRLASWSNDRRKIVVEVDSREFGPGYALIDLEARHADWIINTYAKLGPEDISPVKAVQFKAADGLPLTGYLTTPRGVDAKNLPLIILPHGGPAARDTPSFDWWSQALASRGYAVLQVNYRGSDGFGLNFMQAGFGQWGRKMQTDLSDGVRYLAGEGIIDPKRVCIAGASYGGYASLAGVTLDPGVYRCAVSVAGPSEMRAFVAWARDHHGVESERYWDRFMGAKDTRDPALAEISPALHLDKVNAPILLIHGKDDTVVPLDQSRIMANDLKAAGKPVDFVILDSTDHWLTRGETRLAMLKATVDFLEKNNPPH